VSALLIHRVKMGYLRLTTDRGWSKQGALWLRVNCVAVIPYLRVTWGQRPRVVVSVNGCNSTVAVIKQALPVAGRDWEAFAPSTFGLPLEQVAVLLDHHTSE
jgi:hypothetical protein